jgi:hypothetical protein
MLVLISWQFERAISLAIYYYPVDPKTNLIYIRHLFQILI